MRGDLVGSLGIEHALFGFTYEPAVAAAISRAGGLGVLGAVRFTPDELVLALDELESLAEGRPYGVDVVMPVSTSALPAEDVEQLLAQLQSQIPPEHQQFVEETLDTLGVPPLPEGTPVPPGLLGWTETTARPQAEIALSRDIALLASALGPPPPDVVQAAHDRGVPVAALVGRPDQAVKQREKGVDIIVAQGTEAGGHTGEISTMVLVPQVVDAVPGTPVLAAGGIADARQVRAAAALGAAGVWTGSVWLTSTEHVHQQGLRERLLAARSQDTVRSRCLTGKPARQLRTPWLDAWEDPDTPEPLPMPLQYLLTVEAQLRMRLSGNDELLGLPAGQVLGQLSEARPVAEIVASLTADVDHVAAVRT